MILSLLTYGAVVVVLSGYFSPVAVALGTLLVLLNGLVVQHLSAIYTQNGGFYNYAKALGQNVGTHTGLVYTAYSLLYGGAYVVGTAFSLSFALNVSPLLVSLAITLAATVLVALGIKPSSRYAMVAGILEISVIIYFVAESFAGTHFALYNPLKNTWQGGNIPLAIILGASIPTGYGVLAQVSGEVVDAQRNVGKAMLLVIVIGGLLASAYIFALTNLTYHMGLKPGQLDAGRVLGTMLGFSAAARPLLLFAILSDGVLGAMACLVAATRTLWSMSQDGHAPGFLGALKRGEPANSLLVLAPIYLGATTITMLFASPYQVFVGLGVVSALCSLYIHLVTNTSLVSLNRSRWRILGFAAACYSGLNLFLSLLEGQTAHAAIFFAILAGGLAYLVFFADRRRPHKQA